MPFDSHLLRLRFLWQSQRTLTDDVPDVFFPVITNGKVTGDKVGPHTDLLNEFPYVGAPHSAMT